MSTIPSRRRGFTLLELLVVVAVIGLLLAILLPALSAAMEAGRAAVCGVNLNQLGVGSFAYAESNDQRLPWYGNHPPDGYEWWVTQVAHGLEQLVPVIYRCPSDRIPYFVKVYRHRGTYSMQKPPGARAPGAPRRQMRIDVSYRGSCDLSISVGNDDRLSTPTARVPRKVTSWARPDKAIILVEGNPLPTYHAAMAPIEGPTAASSYHLGILYNMARGQHNQTWNRHFGTTNVLFVDGHVGNHVPQDIGVLARNQEFRLTPG